MAVLVNPALSALPRDDLRVSLALLGLIQVVQLKMLIRHSVSRAYKKDIEIKHRTKMTGNRRAHCSNLREETGQHIHKREILSKFN